MQKSSLEALTFTRSHCYRDDDPSTMDDLVYSIPYSVLRNVLQEQLVKQEHCDAYAKASKHGGGDFEEDLEDRMLKRKKNA